MAKSKYIKTLDLKETIFMALAALKANKLRAFLTLLGVGIGMFSFIGVMTGIAALQETIETSFNVLGSNTLSIQKYPAIQTGPGSRSKYRNRKDITVDEGMYIRDKSKLAQYVNVEAADGGAVVRYQNKETNPNVGVIGGTPEVLMTRNRQISEGRMFTEQELQYGRPVCVIGQSVINLIFPNEYPVGKVISVDGKRLTVVGVVEEQGGLFGGNQDNFIFMPLTTFQNHYGKSRWVNVQAKSYGQESFDAMTDEIIGLMRVARRVPPGEENDFEIISNESLIGKVNEMTFFIRVGTGAVSAIALLAAGIGIMNIMLVSVTERTREIGVRKAIGAQKSSILSQFLVEAIVICQIGGMAGIILGIGGGNGIAILLDIPIVMPIGWTLFGFAVTTLVGVIFGVYPAWKASNLDPIEALRYE
ncbi:MAG: peptide ABC transporter permease [Ectothiorhodospiraceae bacterium]|nr:peptide ABC transporter permease [Ectothiorhodospiraceae bacterium]